MDVDESFISKVLTFRAPITTILVFLLIALSISWCKTWIYSSSLSLILGACKLRRYASASCLLVSWYMYIQSPEAHILWLYGGAKWVRWHFCFWNEGQGSYDNKVITFAFPIPMEKQKWWSLHHWFTNFGIQNVQWPALPHLALPNELFKSLLIINEFLESG